MHEKEQLFTTVHKSPDQDYVQNFLNYIIVYKRKLAFWSDPSL